MSEQRDDKLRLLLDDWARTAASPPAELQRLRANISDALSGQRFLDHEEVINAPRPRRAAYAAVGFCCGAAATLLLCMAIFRPAASPPPRPSFAAELAAAQGAPAAAMLSPEVLAEKTRLMKAMNREFDGGLAWMAETGHDVDLGLMRLDEPSQQATVLVHLVVVHKRKYEQQWSRVWSTDIVTRSEQLINTIPDLPLGSVWAYVLPDGMIAVDCDLSLETPLRTRVKFSGLFKSGDPREVLAVESGDEEFRVFQTVARLTNGAH